MGMLIHAHLEAMGKGADKKPAPEPKKEAIKVEETVEKSTKKKVGK